MPRDHIERDRQAVKDMISAMREATMHVGGLSKETAYGAPHPRDAALYRVLVLGEAATRVSDETQERFHEVPWTDIIGMRNIIIHGYEKVDWDVVWESIQNDFPALTLQLKQVLDHL